MRFTKLAADFSALAQQRRCSHLQKDVFPRQKRKEEREEPEKAGWVWMGSNAVARLKGARATLMTLIDFIRANTASLLRRCQRCHVITDHSYH